MDDIKITEEDVIQSIELFIKIPPFLLIRFINHQSNLVERFKAQIMDYKSQLSDQDLEKINKVIQMPVAELQDILNRAYEKTGQKQLEILGNPLAAPFISGNLKELRKILINEE